MTIFEKEELAEEIIDYVLQDDRESSDFYENPSVTHVYYKVLAYVYGYKYANEVLVEAIKKIGGSAKYISKHLLKEDNKDGE